MNGEKVFSYTYRFSVSIRSLKRKPKKTRRTNNPSVYDFYCSINVVSYLFSLPTWTVKNHRAIVGKNLKGYVSVENHLKLSFSVSETGSPDYKPYGVLYV